MHVIIDTRERDHATIRDALSAEGLSVSVQQLDLGDYVLRDDVGVTADPEATVSSSSPSSSSPSSSSPSSSVTVGARDGDDEDNNESEEGEDTPAAAMRGVLAVFERKTTADLLASIRDGRYRDQFQRLQASGVQHVFYLICGSFDRVDDTQMKQMLSAQTHMGIAAKHVCILYCPRGTQDVVHVLQRAAKYVTQVAQGTDTLAFDQFSSAGAKKKVTAQDAVYLSQLQCMSGMSIDKARAIAAQFPSLSVLLDAFKGSENPPAVLSRVVVGKRNLGPAMSRRLYEALFTGAERATHNTPPEKKKKKKTCLDDVPASTAGKKRRKAASAPSSNRVGDTGADVLKTKPRGKRLKKTGDSAAAAAAAATATSATPTPLPLPAFAPTAPATSIDTGAH